MPLVARRSIRPTLRRAIVAISVVTTLAASHATSAQSRPSLPDSLKDSEFWQFFTSMSEAGGSFLSENFVSNEQEYQRVIPTLQRSLTPGGVYLGVGPEQNFTYIANLKPKMAVIFDIRRQNAMAHLMYKALFELSPTRADFVSRLFSRPLTAPVPSSATASALFDAVRAAPANDSAFVANRTAIFDLLRVKHGFILTPDDTLSIRHVLTSFFEAGPDINYGYRSNVPSFMGPMYATFAELQTLTNAEGVNMAFLASEERYQSLRRMHQKNLVIPVVGDFAGPTAIRAVGQYLKQHGGTVTAFYLSNVEQYLFRGLEDADRFYKNVETLPLDSTSTFIRSVPPGGGLVGSIVTSLNGYAFGSVPASSNNYSVRVTDSAGVSIVWTTTVDSTGRSVTTRSIDSSSGPRRSPLDIFRALRARDDSLARRVVGRDTVSNFGGARAISVRGGTLASGIASMQRTLATFASGGLRTYDQAIVMTKIDGWK